MHTAKRKATFFGLVLVLVSITVIITLWPTRDRPASADNAASPRWSPSSLPKPTPSSATASVAPNVYAGIGRGKFSPRVRGDRSLVYVPNGELGTVEEIDPNTFKVIRRFHVGLYPEHVTPSWNLRHLYVDTAGSSALVVIDPKTGKLVRTIHRIEHPYNLYLTPDGTKAIVVAEYYDRLDFRNPHTWRLIKSVPIPGNGPDHLDFSSDGRFLLISTEFDGNVFRVNTHTMKVTGRVHVGGLPVDVKLSPDGSVFVVANQGLGGVTVIDASTLKVLGFIRTGAGAHGMAVSRDTTSLYLTNRLAGTISVIDFSTRKVTATWRVGGSPDMVQVSPDGTELWVSNRYGTTVIVVSTRTGRVLHSIEVGADPHGLAFFPQPGSYSLGHNGVYR